MNPLPAYVFYVSVETPCVETRDSQFTEGLFISKLRHDKGKTWDTKDGGTKTGPTKVGLARTRTGAGGTGVSDRGYNGKVIQED